MIRSMAATRRTSGSGLRITGGRLRGRRVHVARGELRPTAERVREAVFARLDVSGAEVLDLFAGSGALGFEALSRGAASALFVDRSRRCAAAVRESIRSLGLEEVASVEVGEAVRAVERLGRAGRRFDLVLVDPPYASDELPRVLEALVSSGVLAQNSILVVEHGRRHPVAVARGLAVLDERRYGDTVITRLRADANGPRGEGSA